MSSPSPDRHAQARSLQKQIDLVLHNSLVKQILTSSDPLWGWNPTALLASERAEQHLGFDAFASSAIYPLQDSESPSPAAPASRNSLYRKAFKRNYTFGIGTQKLNEGKTKNTLTIVTCS